MPGWCKLGLYCCCRCCSDDTATRRRKEAEARLRDYGEGEAEGNGTTSGPAAGLLPSAAAAFTDVDGPPSFLDPEVRSHT